MKKSAKKKKSAGVKSKAKVVRKKTAAKKTTAKKRAAPKKNVKAPSKKKVAKKKIAAEKKVAKKKVAPKKKAVKKKVVPKKKVAKKQVTAKIKKKTAKSRPQSSKQSRAKGYMTDKKLKYFSNILIARKKALMEEAGRMVDHMKSDSNQYADSADRATQEEEFTLELRERDRERKLMQKIDEALIKISKKEYGYCVSCGIEIGISRLEARPTTDQCIDCKMLDEIVEQHSPSS